LYLGSFPLRSTVTLTALPAMSLIPFAPLLLVNGGRRSEVKFGRRIENANGEPGVMHAQLFKG
jgi:hypothetical protein